MVILVLLPNASNVCVLSDMSAPASETLGSRAAIELSRSLVNEATAAGFDVNNSAITVNDNLVIITISGEY